MKYLINLEKINLGLEHEEIKKLKINDNIVLAIGGGALFFQNIKLINEKFLSVWIKAKKNNLNRVNKNKINRPMLKNKNLRSHK